MSCPQSSPTQIVIPGPIPIPMANLSVYASYTQTVTGVLIEQIAGHTPPSVYGIPGVDYGQIVIAGNVALDGSFRVRLLNGFVPAVGDKFLHR